MEMIPYLQNPQGKMSHFAREIQRQMKVQTSLHIHINICVLTAFVQTASGPPGLCRSHDTSKFHLGQVPHSRDSLAPANTNYKHRVCAKGSAKLLGELTLAAQPLAGTWQMPHDTHPILFSQRTAGRSQARAHTVQSQLGNTTAKNQCQVGVTELFWKLKPAPPR